MIQIQVFDIVYTFDTVHKAQIFIIDMVQKYFGEDHMGTMDIHIEEKPGHPPVLGINIVEEVKSKDVGPGQK